MDMLSVLASIAGVEEPERTAQLLEAIAAEAYGVGTGTAGRALGGALQGAAAALRGTASEAQAEPSEAPGKAPQEATPAPERHKRKARGEKS